MVDEPQLGSPANAELDPRAPTPPPSEASRGYSGTGAEETLVEGESYGGAPLTIRAGDSVGRYVAIEKLGAGGMGVVWAAYDPELDRRVAVKLLRPDGRSAQKREVARVRLLREAQAMAKLSHPNVVSVHDVGTYEGQIFVAMAYLSGGTLKAALDRREWDWPKTVEVFCQAGEGLAAAHAAGLVHRDFKPDNVILDHVGRPKVVDFGLVRATDSVSDVDTADETHDTHTSGALATSVTRYGAVMGTPAYMAPEQHMGREATPLSDQFSFCVALFEGLYGRSPFPATSLVSLAQRVLSGEIEPPPSDKGVPGYLHQAVLRGLATDPHQRFASMADLLAALRQDRGKIKRRWLAGLGVGAVGLALLTLQAEPETATTNVCAGGEQKVSQVWGQSQRDAMKKAFDASELPYATDTLARTSNTLKQWTQSWAEGHKDACEATELRKEQSSDLMDRRMACLDGQLRSLDARARVLAEANDEVIAQAVDMVDELPDPSRCADTEALLAQKVIPNGPRSPEIRELLDQAQASRGAHRYEESRTQTTQAVSMAREDEDRVRLADALHQLGLLHQILGEGKEAAESFEASAWLSVELDEPADACTSWLHLMDVTGDHLGQDDAWQRWEKAARASLARVRGPNTTLEWHLENALGGIDERNGRNQEALAHYQKALTGLEASGVSGGGLHEHLHNNLGIAHLNLGNYDEAINFLSKARELYVAKYGAEHPHVAAALGNLGNALEVTGKYEEAIEMQREALRLVEGSLPDGHLDIAAAHDNLGNALDGAGQTEAAIEHMRRALALREARLGGDDPSVGISSNNLGDALMRLGRMDEAIEHVERACALFESDYGKDHPHTGVCYNNLARVRHHQGRSKEALEILERAMEIHGKAFGETHPILAYHLVERGRVLRDEGKRAKALDALERAVKLRTEGEEEAMLLAEACFELAKTLPAAQVVRARNLAQRAVDAYRSAGDAATKELAEVESWLSKHQP